MYLFNVGLWEPWDSLLQYLFIAQNMLRMFHVSSGSEFGLKYGS